MADTAKKNAEIRKKFCIGQDFCLADINKVNALKINAAGFAVTKGKA